MPQEGQKRALLIANSAYRKTSFRGLQEAIARVPETFGGEAYPLVDLEPLVLASPKYGTIRFQKIACQIPDERGEILGWCVHLNVAAAEKADDLWRDVRARLMEVVGWSKYAVSYDGLLTAFPEYGALVRQVVDLVGPARRCIDLGAGTGNGSLRLLETLPGREVWAVETNSTMLRYFRVKLDAEEAGGKDYGSRLTFVKDNILRLEYISAASFDAAVLINVLYTVDDPRACLLQARRLLKPGGAVVLSTSHRGTDVGRLFKRMREALTEHGRFEALRANYESALARHEAMSERIHKYTLSETRKLVEDAGFAVAEWLEDQYVGAVVVVRAVKPAE